MDKEACQIIKDQQAEIEQLTCKNAVLTTECDALKAENFRLTIAVQDANTRQEILRKSDARSVQRAHERTDAAEAQVARLQSERSSLIAEAAEGIAHAEAERDAANAEANRLSGPDKWRVANELAMTKVEELNAANRQSAKGLMDKTVDRHETDRQELDAAVARAEDAARQLRAEYDRWTVASELAMTKSEEATQRMTTK